MGASVLIEDTAINEIRYSDSPVMDGATEITIGLWINLASYSGNREYFVAKWTNFSTMDYSFQIDGSAPNETLEMMIRDGANFIIRKSTTLIASALALDTWYFITFSWNYNSGTPIWNHTINGVSQTTANRASSGTVTQIAGTTAPIRIGGINDINYTMDGNIAYVHIYNRAISNEEIKEIMYKPGSVTLNLQHFMPLVDYSTLSDITGNAGNGTKINTVTESTNGAPVQFY